jgi:glycosyltransferase involved in cell wall biosynthesis
MVLTLHEAEPFMPNSGIPVPLLAWWRFVRRASVRRARQILTVSQAARAEVSRYMGVPLAHVRVAHLGVDRATFFPARVPDGSPVPRQPYVFWIGRTYPRKNVERLIGAFTRVAQDFPNLLLVLAGTPGWVEDSVTRLIAQAGAGKVIRPAAGDDVADWYRGATVFAFPSIHESFGLPVIEAMACGTPVVVADIPALREVAGSAAEYVGSLDVADIARGLRRVLLDPTLRESLRSAGLERAAAFRWEDTARATHSAYRAALSGGPT